MSIELGLNQDLIDVKSSLLKPITDKYDASKTQNLEQTETTEMGTRLMVEETGLRSIHTRIITGSRSCQ